MESDRPRCRQGDSNVHPDMNMAPGDYDWNLSYAGSTWLSANSTSGVLRVRGLANATANLSSDWSVRGPRTGFLESQRT